KEEIKSELNVLAENEGKETLSTIKIDCEKCGNNEAVWWMLQTRSADEPTTQFYRCIKCSHTWRNYA
ncbi:MAG: zinc ribbon domain-containing protein, partial [Nitrosopumilaceae archaeon]